MARRKDKFSLAETYNELRADFRAGKDTRFVSRLTGVSSMGSGSDYHYRSEAQWLHMMERARHYQRNDQVVGQGIRRVVANIIQDGFNPDPQTGDADLNAALKAAWQEWSCDPDRCHNEGELTFSQMESLALSHILVDGDIFCLPLKEGTLQWIEAHRCRKPANTTRNVVHGVLMDDQAKRLEYWFTRENLNPYQPLNLVSGITPFPVRDASGTRQILHLYLPYRFSQRRGITVLAPVSDTVGMHDDVQFATLVKLQMGSLIALIRNRGANWSPIAQGQQFGAQSTDEAAGYSRPIEGISAGLEVASDPDEKLEMFSANIPGPQFLPHSMLLLTFIAINLDIPVHVLMLDPSNTNFSGWRGAIDQARIRFKQVQSWMIEKFHCPIWDWWVKQQIARNPAIRRLAARQGVDPCCHRWNPPQFPYIEPLTDIKADDLEVSRCLNSRQRVQAKRGRDQDELRDEIVADNGSMIRAALREAQAINDEFTDAEVNWREVLALPLPGIAAVHMPLATAADDAAEPQVHPEGPAANRLTRYLNGAAH